MPLRPILLLVALVLLSQAVRYLRGFFCCVFVCLFVGIFVGFFACFLLLSSSAKAALQVLHGPFETHLVKGQQFCGTHTTSSTSSCYFSLVLWNLLLFVTLLPQHTLNWPPSPPKVILSLPPSLPRQQQCLYPLRALPSHTEGKNTNPQTPNRPTAALA